MIAHSKKRGGLESADSTCEFNHFTSFDHLFIFKVYRQRKLAMFRKFIERSCMKRVIFDCFSLQLGRVFLGIGVGVPFSCRFGWPFFVWCKSHRWYWLELYTWISGCLAARTKTPLPPRFVAFYSATQLLNKQN